MSSFFLKRALLGCLLFLLTITSLYSSPLEWRWDDNDTGVKYFRYQLNGEDDDRWSIVDAATKSVILESANNNDTLFLQSSYDGVNWSPSSKGTYSKTREVTETTAETKAETKKETGKEKEEKADSSDIGHVTLKWENDGGYNYFRYRRDTNDDNEWTETTGETTSALLPYHEGENTYFIQSSWDGVIWSESGIETYLYEMTEEEVKSPLSLRLNIAPYSSAVYFFYNGHYIDKARTLMGTIYGVSTGLELDYEILPYLRLYLDAGYAYEMKIQTVIPKEQDMQYIKGGVGLDGLVSVSDKTKLYLGALGGIMAHINNNKYNIAPYFGTRLGIETRLSDTFTLGAYSGVTASFLTVEDDTMYSSVTLLIDPVSITLSYRF